MKLAKTLLIGIFLVAFCYYVAAQTFQGTFTSPPTSATITLANIPFFPLQWALASPAVPANGGTWDLSSPTTLRGYYSDNLPYTVPAGQWLFITDVSFSQKQLSLRNNYLSCIGFGTSFQSSGGNWVFPIPIVIQPGKTINCQFINNNAEDMNMSMTIHGFTINDNGYTASQAMAVAKRAMNQIQ